MLEGGTAHAAGLLVLQSDLGSENGEVAALKGIAFSQDSSLTVTDLSHDVPTQDVWTGAFELAQVLPAWPAGTVFVSLVNAAAAGAPGATERPPLIVKLRTGQILVAPDNGALTLAADEAGIAEVRELDKTAGGSAPRKVPPLLAAMLRTAAGLASGELALDQAGPVKQGLPVTIPYAKAALTDGRVVGTIFDIDLDLGDAVTNIDGDTMKRFDLHAGERIHARVMDGNQSVWEGDVPFVKSPAAVAEGETALYVGAAGMVTLAVNMGSFADQNGVGSGPGWTVSLAK